MACLVRTCEQLRQEVIELEHDHTVLQKSSPDEVAAQHSTISNLQQQLQEAQRQSNEVHSSKAELQIKLDDMTQQLAEQHGNVNKLQQQLSPACAATRVSLHAPADFTAARVLAASYDASSGFEATDIEMKVESVDYVDGIHDWVSLQQAQGVLTRNGHVLSQSPKGTQATLPEDDSVVEVIVHRTFCIELQTAGSPCNFVCLLACE